LNRNFQKNKSGKIVAGRFVELCIRGTGLGLIANDRFENKKVLLYVYAQCLLILKKEEEKTKVHRIFELIDTRVYRGPIFALFAQNRITNKFD